MSFLNFNCEDIKNHKAQSGYNLKYLLLDNVNAGFKQSIKIKLSDYIKRPLDCSYDYCKIVKAGTTDAYTKVTQIDSKSYNLITSLLYAHKPDQFQLACNQRTCRELEKMKCLHIVLSSPSKQILTALPLRSIIWQG